MASVNRPCKKILIQFLRAFNPDLTLLSDNLYESPEMGSRTRREQDVLEMSSASRDAAAEELLSRLGDTENYPDEHLAPYKEFRIGANTYYFTSEKTSCQKLSFRHSPILGNSEA